MVSYPKPDPYLERLRTIQAETMGIDARLSALELGYTLDVKTVDEYVEAHIAQRPARYEDFLTKAEIKAIAVNYNEVLNKGIECDTLDYALAATCGIVSGLMDALLVSTPGEGVINEASDNLFDGMVKTFARKMDWRPHEGNENNVRSAIGFLERKFKVGYDQAKSTDIDYVVEHITPKNHHAKSPAHYPDLIGLIASIANQFTETSTFFDSNKGIVFVSDTGKGTKLRGDTISAKVFAGFVNWLGHCMSDVAGSSGSQSRGQGLPLPFTEFFQLCNFGKFPNEKGQWQSLAQVMTQVYEQGYDLRHGVATTVPVVVNDLLVRAVYTVKRHFVDGLGWSECLPKGDSPEMQRMITVGIGSMCLVDLGHAAVTSWGNWVKFFSGLNITAWARFGLQGARELQQIAERDTRNLLAINDNISHEWESLLERSRLLLS
ncbi:hypothetical protein [Adlercreutzia sp. ZJ141]|uniref:hypothetical protein n=1 Tax=Adlercreutzia sp. ZJ141 TaxID=2709406 RepID=UPI0013EDDBBC|nr:hypothetical protein [Adlercreutzia sp. ZJ141]